MIFRHFAYSWTVATVVTIPKLIKDQMFSHNYLSISLLNTMDKIAEIIILNLLNEHSSQIESSTRTGSGSERVTLQFTNSPESTAGNLL